MRFITWLFDQMDLGTETSKMAKLCWDDINNGCASIKYGPSDWVEHFNSKHKDKAPILIEKLLDACVEYRKEKNLKL